MEQHAPKPPMVVKRKRIEHFFPAQLTDRLTPLNRLFVSTSMGVAEISSDDWRLEITGLIDTPTSLSFDDLKRRPKRTLETVYVCSGNPAKPTVPMRRAANVRWGGIDLADLLGELGIQEGATHILAYGLDHGTYARTTQAHFLKDMPVSRLREGDVLIAYELNDAPLTQKHGFPARLVIPGYYGTNCVKWLGRLELADRRAESIFTTRFYNDPDLDADPSGTVMKPVWAVAPESIIVSPAPKSEVAPNQTEIWGWAWSSCAVRSVEVSTDGGETWHPAELDAPDQRSWQRFSYVWSPSQPGQTELRCRATDVNGESQPVDGARNAVYSLIITVED